MPQKQDIRSWAPIPAHKSQLTGTIYEPGKNWQGGLDAMVASIRRELRSIIEVVDLTWLANPAWRSDKRRRAIVAAVEAIEERGGRLKETSTGDETPKNRIRMLMRAYEKASGARSALNGKLSNGRPPFRGRISDTQWAAAKAIWESRKFKTRVAALAAVHAIGMKVSMNYMYTHFGKRD